MADLRCEADEIEIDNSGECVTCEEHELLAESV